MQKKIYQRILVGIIFLGLCFAIIYCWILNYTAGRNTLIYYGSVVGLVVAVFLIAILLILVDRAKSQYRAHNIFGMGIYLVNLEHPRSPSIKAFSTHFEDGELVSAAEIVILPVKQGKETIETAFKRKYQEDIVGELSTLS